MPLAFSTLRWAAVTAWALGFLALLFSYFSDWLSFPGTGADLGEFMNTNDALGSISGPLSLCFIAASAMASLFAAAALVLRDGPQKLICVVAGVLAVTALLLAVWLMLVAPTTDAFVNYSFATGSYAGIAGAVLLGVAAALARRPGQADAENVGLADPGAG